MAAAKANIYEMVTARIIAEFEKGNIPWEKPWTGVRSGAYNRISKKAYSIINQMLYSTPENMLHLNSGQIWAVTSVKVRNQSL